MKKLNFESLNLINEKIPFLFDRHTVVYENRFKYPAVWHNDIEIVYIVDGEGEFIAGSNAYHMLPGDILIVNSNEIHDFSSDTSITYYFLIADNEFCLSNGIDCTTLRFTHHIKSAKAEQLFQKIVSEYQSAGPFREAAIKSAVLGFLVHAAQNFSTSMSKGGVLSEKLNEHIRLAIGYMRAHFDEDISLERIAGEFGLSKFHFSRAFKKATGVTVITYINVLRCNYAQTLLAKNELSIHDTAIKCGFANDSYFTKTFRKYTGLTPSQFAKKFRKKD